MRLWWIFRMNDHILIKMFSIKYCFNHLFSDRINDLEAVQSEASPLTSTELFLVFTSSLSVWARGELRLAGHRPCDVVNGPRWCHHCSRRQGSPPIRQRAAVTHSYHRQHYRAQPAFRQLWSISIYWGQLRSKMQLSKINCIIMNHLTHGGCRFRLQLKFLS